MTSMTDDSGQDSGQGQQPQTPQAPAPPPPPPPAPTPDNAEQQLNWVGKGADLSKLEKR
jgi:hypothetical protein